MVLTGKNVAVYIILFCEHQFLFNFETYVVMNVQMRAQYSGAVLMTLHFVYSFVTPRLK
jgi:hypothetical protein